MGRTEGASANGSGRPRQRGHSEAERFVTDRGTELAQRRRQELEPPRKSQDPVCAWLSAPVGGTARTPYSRR